MSRELLLGLVVLASCTDGSAKKNTAAVAVPAPGAAPIESAALPAGAVKTRAQLIAAAEGLLTRANMYTTPEGSAACAAPEDINAVLLAELLIKPNTRCDALDREALREIDDALENARFDDEPHLTGETANALRTCMAPAVDLVLGAAEFHHVCSPTRPGGGHADAAPLERLQQFQHLSRAIGLKIFDLARAGRAEEATIATLRLVDLSQAAGRGQVSYLEAALAMTLTKLPMARLRVELGSRRGAASLSAPAAREIGEAVERLIKAEPAIVDVITGDRVALDLGTMLPIAAPEHPALSLGSGKRADDLADPTAAFGDKFVGIEDPLAVIWSAAVAAHDESLQACQDKTPAACRAADHAIAERTRREFQAEVGTNDVAALMKAANPDTSTAFAFRLAQNAMAIPMPDLQERGRDLASLRLRLKLSSVDACPSQEDLEDTPFTTLRNTEFSTAPIHAEARDSSIILSFDDDFSHKEDHERWRLICDVEALPAGAPSEKTAPGIRFAGTPHDEEDSHVRLEWRSAGLVGLHAEPDANSFVTKTLQVKAGERLDLAESVVVVTRPSRVLATTDADLGRGPIYDPNRPDAAGGAHADFKVKSGDEVRVYRYDAEGECYVGITGPGGAETIAIVTCPQVEDFHVKEGALDRPAASQWWVQPAAAEGWVFVDDKTFVIDAGFHGE